MEIIIDDKFKDSYEYHYGKYKDKVVLDCINHTISSYDAEIVTDSVNVVKTCATLRHTYSKCYKNVFNKVASRFPVNDDIDKFILSIVIRIMIATGSSSLEKIINSERNIEREITAKHFRTSIKNVTEEMISEVISASDSFTDSQYSMSNYPPVNSWDEYFYNICIQVSRNSKCFSRRLGCVLVYDKSVISTGYNGPPRGIPRCDLRSRLDVCVENEIMKRKEFNIDDDSVFVNKCPRKLLGYKSGEGLELCVAGHAERNALINAARNGIRTKGTSLYLNAGVPCKDCLIEIINAGVQELVIVSLKTFDDESMYLLSNSDIDIRFFDFIK
jgi:dCMP deaminase